MASRFVAVTNKEISQIIRKDVFEKHEQGDEINFLQVQLCLFNLNQFIDETAEKAFLFTNKLNANRVLSYFI